MRPEYQLAARSSRARGRLRIEEDKLIDSLAGPDRPMPDGSAPGPAARPPRWAVFEDERVRLGSVAAMLTLALLSPNIGLPAGLPAVRLEQLLLALLLLPLAGFAWRHPEARRLGLIDAIFAGLVVTVAVSIALAPASFHRLSDIFEIARPVEYWLCYRLALTVAPDERAASIVVGVTLGAAAMACALALVQYPRLPFDGGLLASVWATGHNLEGVTTSGRVVGTAGNANVFGSLAGGLALIAFWVAVGARSVRLRVAGAVVVVLGAMTLMLSQSRTALVATGIGLLLTLIVERRRLPLRTIAGALLGGLLGVALATVLLVRLPPLRGQVVSRFDPAEVGADPSVVVRLARLQTFLAAPDPHIVRTTLCATPVGRPAAGHEPAMRLDPSGASEPAAAQRDQTRKADVDTIAQAIMSSYCRTGRWPSGAPSSLVPSVIPALPRDPSSGAPYDITLSADGFRVGATLESASDPDGPEYVLGASPNLFLNPSFEQGGAAPTDWQWDSGTQASLTGDALFGRSAADVAFDGQGYFEQYVVYRFPTATTYSVHGWARSVGPQPTSLELYVVALLTDGSRISPIAHISLELPGGGRWVPLAARFTTPGVTPVWVLQVLMRPAQGVPSEVQFDGFSLTQGSVAPSFAGLRDIDPAKLPSAVPSWWQSPLFGIGPIDTLESGSFDDEYLLVIVRFGLFGLAAYLALYLGAAGAAWRGRGSTLGPTRQLAVGLLGYVAALMVFNLAAGSYFNYQVMAFVWLVVGVCLAFGRRPAVPSTDARPAS